jgi:hypothetical protein
MGFRFKPAPQDVQKALKKNTENTNQHAERSNDIEK